MLNECCLENKNLIEKRSKVAAAGDVKAIEDQSTIRRCQVCGAMHYAVNSAHRIFLAKDLQAKDGAVVVRFD